MFMSKGLRSIVVLGVIACSTNPCAQAAEGETGAEGVPAWFAKDKLASELSQLSPGEFSKFSNSRLLDVGPVVVPSEENIVGTNDYFMCPWATAVDGTIVVLYQRAPCHWGDDKNKADENTGIRMIVTSSDGGKTWSRPLDILNQTGERWAEVPFWGFGGGLGTHDGIVYAALREGVYRSKDKGRSWALAASQPSFAAVPNTIWAPGARVTFDATRGLVLWSTRGFSKDTKARMSGKYGTHLVALYSPDFGKTWRYEEQPLPEGLRLSEVSPIAFDGKMAFLLRNGLKNARFGHGYSASGWFPFTFGVSEIGPVAIMDTPDINYNPVTKRLEAAAPHRLGSGPGPKDGMKVNLYSITPAELAMGKTQWRFDGTLVSYRKKFGQSDGFGVVGSIIDTARNVKHFHVWGGDCRGTAGIFQYSVSLDTPAVSRYLHRVHGTGEPDKPVPATPDR